MGNIQKHFLFGYSFSHVITYNLLRIYSCFHNMDTFNWLLPLRICVENHLETNDNLYTMYLHCHHLCRKLLVTQEKYIVLLWRFSITFLFAFRKHLQFFHSTSFMKGDFVSLKCSCNNYLKKTKKQKPQHNPFKLDLITSEFPKEWIWT